MIIDFHTHTFPDAIAEKTINLLKSKSNTIPFCDGTNKCLSLDGKSLNIDLSVVLPVVTNPLKTQKINDTAVELNKNYTNLLSFGGVHPDTENVRDEIKRIADLGLKGIKIHPAYQQVKLNDIRFKRIVEYAEEFNLITITHGGIDIGIDGDWASPLMAKELICDVKPNKFVIAHTGGWSQWDDVLTYLCGENVYFDTSFSYGSFYYNSTVDEAKKVSPLTTKQLVEIIKAHGSEKILFGTDSPWGDRRDQIEKISALPLSVKEKDDIFYKNAKNLLKI